MGLFNFFRKRDETVTQTDELVNDVLLKAMLKGEKIDKEKAISLPAVSSAVDRICNTVAMIPIKLYKESIDETTGKKKVEEVKSDPRIKLLNTEPGDTLDAFQMRKAWVQDYLLDKGGYLYIEKSKNKFKSLRYVDASNVTINTNFDPIFKDITYMVQGKNYETFNFLTILRSTKNGGSGRSVISEVSTAIENAYQTLLYELGLVKTGGAKKGFITSQRRLGEKEIQMLKQAWANLYSNKSDNAIVLNEGMDFKEGSSTTVELQLNERKKTLQDEIDNIFHNKPNFDEFMKEAVMPILSAIKTALNKDFLLEKEKESFYFEFDTREITRGNIKERYEAYKVAAETGWISKNEIRYLEDYDSIEGLDVITLNLANVVFDINTGKYYTPNTNAIVDMNGQNGGGNNES
ncbi:MAG: phage portal protein [Clostridia bacterium]|mgnify:FL=1|jgi:HK97 family phage portal protein|nr:phage portal protein [Clostridium sp.]DAE58894.1 MAG TPA: portal protein [Caudoviricetes sp.]